MADDIWKIPKADETLVQINRIRKAVKKSAAQAIAANAAATDRLEQLAKGIPDAVKIPDHGADLAKLRADLTKIAGDLSEFRVQTLSIIGKLASDHEKLVKVLSAKRKYEYSFERDYDDRIKKVTINEVK